jgi:hypothetical protein
VNSVRAFARTETSPDGLDITTIVALAADGYFSYDEGWRTYDGAGGWGGTGHWRQEGEQVHLRFADIERDHKYGPQVGDTLTGTLRDRVLSLPGHGELQLLDEPPSFGLNRTKLLDHEAWLDRGRTGPGRLEATDTNTYSLSFALRRLDAARFVRVKLGFELTLASLVEAELVECEGEGARFDHSVLTKARFERCRLAGARFFGTNLGDATFVGCDVRDISLHHTDLTGTRFVDCQGAPPDQSQRSR